MKRKLYFVSVIVMGATCLMGCNNKNPTYQVTWILNNGSEPIVEKYKKGDMPECKNTPVYKMGEDEYHIRYFAGWDKLVVPVVEDTTYNATYDENSQQIATLVTFVNLREENKNFKFKYEGALTGVFWGSGDVDYTVAGSGGIVEHNFAFNDANPISACVVIYGKLTSFALSDATGKLSKAAAAIQNVVLSETINKVPDNAFNGLSQANCFMIDTNAKYVGKDAFKGNANNAVIYLQSSFDKSALQSGWNPNNRSVVENVTRLHLHQEGEGENSVFYGLINLPIDGAQRFALADFYPYNGEQKEFDELTIPSEINIDNQNTKKIDAIIYSPFRHSIYNFNTINLPSNLAYVGLEGFRYTYAKNVTIPTNVQTIKASAFSNLSSINITFTEDVVDGDTTIGDGAFSYNLYLNEINNFPSSVVSLEPEVFFNCPQLKKINGFGDCKITNLPAETFGACGSLREISLPKTLNNIEARCFNCASLETIDATRITPDAIPTCAKNAFLKTSDTLTVFVNSDFGNADAAMTAFTAKGWPKTFNYSVSAPNL